MKQYFDEKLHQEFKERYNKSTLTKQELSNELGVSVNTINSYIVKKCGIPEYVKIGTGKNGKVLFPVVNVVSFLSNTIKVAS